MRNKLKLLGALVMGGGLALTGTALTQANTFDNTQNIAGFGSNAVTGVTVTDVHYDYAGGASPVNLDAVTFTLQDAVTLDAGEARVNIKDGGDNWTNCNAVAAATTLVCPSDDSLPVADITGLDLIVGQ